MQKYIWVLWIPKLRIKIEHDLWWVNGETIGDVPRYVLQKWSTIYGKKMCPVNMNLLAF